MTACESIPVLVPTIPTSNASASTPELEVGCLSKRDDIIEK
jgi:hypothetical protein